MLCPGTSTVCVASYPFADIEDGWEATLTIEDTSGIGLDTFTKNDF